MNQPNGLLYPGLDVSTLDEAVSRVRMAMESSMSPMELQEGQSFSPEVFQERLKKLLGVAIMKIHKPRTYYRIVRKGLFGEYLVHEPRVMKEMRKIRGDLFVDVGANRGSYALGLRRHFKRVVACEPNPQFVAELKKHSKRNIEILPVAISDKDGKATLFFDDTPGRCDGSADTILPVFEYNPSSKGVKRVTFQGKNGIPVETRSLDSLFHGPIDLVKIDVEGAEFLVLHGAQRLLREGSIGHVMVELHNSEKQSDLVRLFASHGYGGLWVDSDHYYAYK